MNNVEIIISQVDKQIDVYDKKISKIYIFQEEITKEDIEALSTDIELLRNSLKTLQTEVSILMNQGNLSYISHCTKSITIMDNGLNKLGNLLSSKNTRTFIRVA